MTEDLGVERGLTQWGKKKSKPGETRRKRIGQLSIKTASNSYIVEKKLNSFFLKKGTIGLARARNEGLRPFFPEGRVGKKTLRSRESSRLILRKKKGEAEKKNYGGVRAIPG